MQQKPEGFLTDTMKSWLKNAGKGNSEPTIIFFLDCYPISEKYSSGAETYEKRIPDSACRHLKLHDIMKFMSDGRAYDELSHRE